MSDRAPSGSGRPRSVDADRAVLEAALDLFIEGGIDAVKMETAAKRAGVSRATVYRRYPRREDLVIEAISEAYRHVERPTPAHPTVADIVEGIAAALADGRVRRVLRRLMSVPHDHPELFAEYRKVTGVPDREQVIHRVLEQEAARGGFPSGTDLEMVQTLFQGSIGTHLLTRPDDEKVEQIIAFLYRVLNTLGYRPPAEATKESR